MGLSAAALDHHDKDIAMEPQRPDASFADRTRYEQDVRALEGRS